ncbi:MAG: MBL fold metallo-hydrolase, partial [Betaproteobacteria bacterium]|nr:MBL fold metallo-hydrolase [Betaproteobacteria bacterium]
MELRILGADGTQCEGCSSIAALADGRVLIDAGTGAHGLSLAEIDRIGDALITHSHLDHTGMLCFIAETRIGAAGGPGLRVHAFPETVDAIREGFLNGKIWPDFENIKVEGKPLMSFSPITVFNPVDFGGLRATPFPVLHAGLPTAGFCLNGGREDFVFISDIYEMPEETYAYLAALKNFRRMTVEISYPEGKEDLAKVSGHLTPKLLEKILARLPENLEVYYCHVKPRYRTEIVAQTEKRFN